MSGEFLHRGDAPFSAAVWQQIDATVVSAAASQLAGRRLLDVEGPYGLGLKFLPGSDQPVGEGVERASPAVPLTVLQAGFSLPVRDIANFEQTGLPFDLSVVARAAVEIAAAEDKLVFHGNPETGAPGLLTAPGVGSAPLSEWDVPGKAVQDLIAAVSALDDAGLHGPYALGLAPKRYNALFRLYDQGNMTELEHVRTLITGGVVKAPALTDGGVLVAVGKQYASLVLGQDLMAGFVGPSAGAYEFFLMESLALRLSVPSAVCVLK